MGALGVVGGSGGSFLTAPLDRGTGGAAQPAGVAWNRPFNTVFVAAAGIGVATVAVLGFTPTSWRNP